MRVKAAIEIISNTRSTWSNYLDGQDNWFGNLTNLDGNFEYGIHRQNITAEKLEAIISKINKCAAQRARKLKKSSETASMAESLALQNLTKLSGMDDLMKTMTMEKFIETLRAYEEVKDPADVSDLGKSPARASGDTRGIYNQTQRSQGMGEQEMD
jgi:hypothetical protein